MTDARESFGVDFRNDEKPLRLLLISPGYKLDVNNFTVFSPITSLPAARWLAAKKTRDFCRLKEGET